MIGSTFYVFYVKWNLNSSRTCVRILGLDVDIEWIKDVNWKSIFCLSHESIENALTDFDVIQGYSSPLMITQKYDPYVNCFHRTQRSHSQPDRKHDGINNRVWMGLKVRLVAQKMDCRWELQWPLSNMESLGSYQLLQVWKRVFNSTKITELILNDI